MADDKLIIGVGLDTKETKRDFDKIEQQGKGAAKDVGGFFKNAMSTALGVGLGSLAVGGITKGLGFLRSELAKTIDLAATQEDAVNSLNTALRLSGKYSKEASDDFQVFASSIQESSILGDEALLQNAALIQSLGNLSVKGLKRATQAAADLSAALGIDLAGAATLVGKAAAGEVGSFSRYGLVIKKGADNAETFAKAMAALEGKFGGAAASKVNTFSGAWQQLQNTWGDLLEIWGESTTKSTVLIAMMKKLSGFILSAQSALKGFNGEFSFIDFAIKKTIELGLAINDYIIRPLEFVGRIGSVVFDAVKLGLQGVTNLVTKVGSGIASLLNFAGIENSFTETLINMDEAVSATTDNMANDLVANWDKGFGTGFSEKTQMFLEDLQLTADAAGPIAEQLGDNISKPLKKVADDVAETAKKIEVKVGASLAGGLGKAIQHMAGNLAKGKSIFADFGKFIMNLMGDMMVQVGMALMSAGIGMSALGNLSPGAAIAAGAGLVAIGTIMKSFLGGGGSESVTATGGGGGVTSSPTEIAEPVEEDDRSPKTEIQVNIAGDVLDSEESGMKIIELINSSFDMNGSLVRAV